MYIKYMEGVTTRQIMEHRFHVGGKYNIFEYLTRYVIGLKSQFFVYSFKFQFLFLKKVLLVFSNAIKTYYDKVLFINGHLGYSSVFRHLCLTIDMPFLYTKWSYGTLSNIFYFYRGVSRMYKNNLEGFIDLYYIPSLVFNLTGLYNFSSLKEGRTLGAATGGILDYDLSVIQNKKIMFDKYGFFSYFFLGNDDNIKSLNFIMYLVIICLYYKKLLLFSLINIKNYSGYAPFYNNDDYFPTKIIDGLCGSFIFFYKNFGSYNFLKRFFWFRSLKDYHFFHDMSSGNYERLTQEYLSLYTYHVCGKFQKKIFFLRQQVYKRVFFSFFNLFDHNFLRQIHSILFNAFFKLKYRPDFLRLGKYVRVRLLRLDTFTIFSFFLFEKFYYTQLVTYYGSIYHGFDVNFGLNCLYYNYIYSYSNVLNFKMLIFYKKLINIVFYNNYKYNDLGLNLYKQLRTVYGLAYFFNSEEKRAQIYKLHKKHYKFLHGYYFERNVRGRFAFMFRNYNRNFYTNFYKFLKKKRYSSWSKQRFKTKEGKMPEHFIYYFDFYKAMQLISIKRIVELKMHVRYDFEKFMDFYANFFRNNNTSIFDLKINSGFSSYPRINYFFKNSTLS